MHFLLSAGEASGDTYGAQLIESLKELAPSATFIGMGGEKMEAAGCELVVNAAEVAVVGLVEVLTHLPRIYGKFQDMVASSRQREPVAAILIDFPEFNLRLARKLHELKIPVFYFVSPQVWAWRSGRVKQIQKYVRKMIVIFPFEVGFYRKHNVKVSYVGHPLAYAPEPSITREEFAACYDLNASKPWIALLPGSRKKEVQMNLPAMLKAAELLGDEYEFVLPVASTLKELSNEAADSSVGFVNWFTTTIHSRAVPITLTEDSRSTVKHSVAGVIASGTATVEAALLETPFVVVYRLSPLTWLLGRRLVKLDTFAMPNLIAGRKIVKELIQRDFTAQNIVKELEAILPDGARRWQMLKDLTQVREKLRDSKDPQPPAMRAAREILQGVKTH